MARTRMPRFSRRIGVRRDAVTPIIGTILVLFIVLVAVAGILLWGVPAIQGIQAHSEFEAVLTQFVELNSDITTLRDPQSAKVDRISVNRGLLSMEAGGRWLFVATNDTTLKTMRLSGWESDAAASVTLDAPTINPAASVTLDRAIGSGSVFSELSTCANACGAASLSLAGNAITGDAYRVRVKEGNNIRAEAWIVNVGRISYALDRTSELNRVYLTMGAVINRQGNALFMEDPPTVKDPNLAAAPVDVQYLVRAFDLEGASAASGKGRFPVALNLVDNYGMTRGRTTFGDAVSVRIMIDDSGLAGESIEEAFCNHFSQRDGYVQEAGDCDAGTVDLLYDPGQAFTYDLNHSVVNVLVQSI